jgi:glycosyltransferase involved in cell wall biosynthesis
MRIALVASLLPSDSRGGAEAYVEAAAHSLAERHDIQVFTGSDGVLDAVPTVHLPRLPEFHQADRPTPYRLVWHARDQWRPSVHRALERELGRWQPDVIMSHHPQGLSAAVFTAIARNGAPHVHTAHDLNVLCARTSMTRGGEYCGGQCMSCRVQRAIRARALRLNLARLMCVSDYVCTRHIEFGVVPEEKTCVIRLGAQPGVKRLRRLEGAGPRLGFIGTLSPHKGILTLLEAFADAPPHWRLLVAGSGPLESAVESAAANDARITYLGHVEHDAKDAFFDALDLLVIPSEWEEPATFVAVEAAVRGLPSLVSDRGGLPENPETRTFRARDPGDLLRVARSYVDDPATLEATSRRLLERSDEFTWATHVAQVEALFDDVLAEAAAGAGYVRSPER